MGGSAVLVAAQALRSEIARAASVHFGCALEAIEIEPGLRVRTPMGSWSAADLGSLKLRAEGEFASDRRTYGFGAAAAHVTVDPLTGRVVLVDYLALQDIGRIINPLTAHGQVIGAIVQGLGGVFLENLVYDDEGQLLVGTLADYLMPTAADFPRLRAMLFEDTPSHSNPLGAKGVGEGGIIPVAGVVSNAVAAALSSLKVEPNSLPLSPSRVWEAIQRTSPERNRFNEPLLWSRETNPG
jgi:carbon-monoxide dehydrogenase large subunit